MLHLVLWIQQELKGNMHAQLRKPRTRGKAGGAAAAGGTRMRGTARHYNQHDRHDHTSIMSFLPLGPLPAMILGTFLLCYALVLACLLPMLSVSRDESSSLHVRGTVRRKFSGLDGAHLPQKADLFKAGSVVRQEFKTVKQEIKDIGGKVRQKLHPAYGQLIDEAVGEFSTERERRRKQRQTHRAEAERLLERGNTAGDTSISQRDGFVVLGMHRSGTSMLSGLLVSGMGYNVGKPLIGAAFDNEKGFFELRTAVLQSDEFMKKQHVWWASGVVNYDADKALKMKEANELDFAQGEAALKFLNNPLSTPWLWKDPRLCITIKTWLPLLKTEPAIIFTYRHPLEVAMSLEKREDDFDLEHGLRIWIAYNMRAVQNMKGMCQVLSSNEAILANPLKETQRISDELTTKCHVPAPPNKLTQEVVDSFIDPKLQHNKREREAEVTKHELLVTRGDKCEIRDYDSSYEKGSMHRERETRMYLKAMNVFCDLKSGEAFKEDYEWPSLR